VFFKKLSFIYHLEFKVLYVSMVKVTYTVRGFVREDVSTDTPNSQSLWSVWTIV